MPLTGLNYRIYSGVRKVIPESLKEIKNRKKAVKCQHTAEQGYVKQHQQVQTASNLCKTLDNNHMKTVWGGGFDDRL